MATVESMSTQRITSISEATIMLECIHCIRLIINSHVGLEIIVQKEEYTRTLIQGDLISYAELHRQLSCLEMSLHCLFTVLIS